MNAQLSPVAPLLLILASTLAAASNETDSRTALTPSARDFTAFKVISDRNIFNPEPSHGTADGVEQTRPKRTETVVLVGTLSYDKGPYAFFDGSAPDYRKVLEPGKSI